MNPSPSERRLRAQIAANTLHARYDSHEITRPASEAVPRRFHDEVDPDHLQGTRRPEVGRLSGEARASCSRARNRCEGRATRRAGNV